MSRTWPVLLLCVGCASAPAATLDPSVEQKYQASCAACHETGAADAPLAHDTAEWSRRARRGIPTLVDAVKTGTTVMPPRGMCHDCDDAHLEALVHYMIAPR